MLHQVVAVRKDRKGKIDAEITARGSENRKADLFKGLVRRYVAKDADGDVQPDERNRVQRTAEDALAFYRKAYTELFTLEATVDTANTHAVADVKVEGKVFLTGVPATHLLYLEKKLAELSKLIEEMPVLDGGQEWKWDEALGLFRTEPIKKLHMKKVQRAIVKYDATPEHPAQTEMISEDVSVGTWDTVHQSGAMLPGAKAKLLERFVALLSAVKAARAEANTIDAPPVDTAGPLFRYLFATP
jgi:hypothetical protein